VLRAWGSHEGFENNYLPYISNIYKERCLFMINLFEKYLPKSTCEWPEGSGGMFLWVRLKTEAHPEIATLSPEDISNRVFKQAIDERVLLAQSRYFKSAGGKEWTKEEEAKRIYLRLCFANPTLEDMEEGVQRFARALKREFKLE
jgi:aromatic amino acid aminotransferase I